MASSPIEALHPLNMTTLASGAKALVGLHSEADSTLPLVIYLPTVRHMHAGRRVWCGVCSGQRCSIRARNMRSAGSVIIGVTQKRWSSRRHGKSLDQMNLCDHNVQPRRLATLTPAAQLPMLMMMFCRGMHTTFTPLTTQQLKVTARHGRDVRPAPRHLNMCG